MANPKCYFDIEADGKRMGRIIMEVMYMFFFSGNNENTPAGILRKCSPSWIEKCFGNAMVI